MHHGDEWTRQTLDLEMLGKMGRTTDQISPEDLRLQALARARTSDLLGQAIRQWGLTTKAVEIRFDLRGRAAGQARYGGPGPWVIRYNPVLLRENPERFMAETIAHEVAHVVAYARHGHRIRPHGPEWRAIMEHFGAAPERCHGYDVSRVPGRATRLFPYHCGCANHQLSSIRHHRVLAGRIYLCRHCAAPLRPGRRGLSALDAVP